MPFKPKHPKDNSLADISDCAIRIGYKNNLKEYFQKKIEALPSGYHPYGNSVEDIGIFLDNCGVLQAILDGSTLLLKVKNNDVSELKEYETNCARCSLKSGCDVPSEVEEKIKNHNEIMCAYGDSML